MNQQQFIFAPGERYFDPIRVEQTPAGGFQSPAGKLDRLGGRFLGGSAIARGAAQNGADAGQQFARVEGLCQIIISAEFKPHDAIRLLTHCGQDHDGHIGLGAQPAGEIKPRFARHHEVEHNKMIAPKRP